MTDTNWKRELTIAAAMLGFGLFVLPFAIYVVGQRLIGEYDPSAGVGALYEHIWIDFLSLRAPALILIVGPYVTVQLIRGIRRVWRRRRAVIPVTE
jgi:hypothetical protein